MKIENLEYDDLPALNALQPPDWTNINDSVRYYLKTDYCYPIKLVIDEQLLGIGTTIFLEDTVWLAHIIVHPDFRNRGFGRKITQFLIDSVYRSKYETIYLIATDLGAAVYNKLGFITETTYSFYKDGTNEFDIHPAIIPYSEKMKPALLALDRMASGEDRSRFLLEHMEGALVMMDGQELTGFYLPAIRDGLVIANNNHTGIDLMKRRLKDHKVAMLPDDNATGIRFLKEHHYTEFKKAKRMRLGKVRAWHPEFYFNRIGGQLG